MVDKLSFDKLWRGAPFNNSQNAPCRLPKDIVEDGKTLLRGTPSYHNQCAIRIGVALHAAGVTIGDMGGVATCSYHPAEDMHCLNAQATAEAIGRLRIANLGQKETYAGNDAANFYPKIIGRRGIIFFQDYWYRSDTSIGADGSIKTSKESTPSGDHIDVWNGYRTSAAFLMEWFSWLGYYSNYADARAIWFWEVK